MKVWQQRKSSGSTVRRTVMALALLCAPPLWSDERQPTDNPDPWEGFNRKVFVFNDTFDHYLLKPLARGYMAVMPDWADRGLYNFFSNLTEPRVIVNGLLQGKFKQAGSDGVRFVLNSTVGLLGFIDVASRLDLRKHDEDFGQSLGVWGLSSGPYLVLPLLGPSTVRDGVGLAPDFMLDPIAQIDEDDTRYAVMGFKAVIVRARLLSSEKLISGDRYLFIRDAYLQNREFRIKGPTRDSFLDEGDE